MVSFGKGVSRHGVNDIDIRSQVKGKEKTRLFSNRENIIYLPSTQMFDLLTLHGLFSLARHDQDL